jgi:TctA family transporter
METTIYWITRLDAIIAFLGTLAVICGVALVPLCISYFSDPFSWEDDENDKLKKKKYGKWIKRSIITGGVAGILMVFIPSKDDAILIYAGGKTYDYIKSDTSLQKIPYLTTEYLKTVLQKEVDEIKKDAQ